MRQLFTCLIASSCFIVGYAGVLQALPTKADLSVEEPYDAVIDGVIGSSTSSLAVSAENLLRTDSLAAMQMFQQTSNRNIIVDSVSFDRLDGNVSARATIWDGSAPRDLRIFIDIFGDGNQVLSSLPYKLNSTGLRQPVSMSFKDFSNFRRFEFRFEYEGEQLKIGNPKDAGARVSGIDGFSPLFHHDFKEARQLLDQLGYMKSRSSEPAAMFGAIRRFRSDNNLSGPAYVSLGDLYALRIVAKTKTGPTSLLPYIEWASGSRGGWKQERREFTEEQSPAGDEVASLPAEDSTNMEEDQ